MRRSLGLLSVIMKNVVLTLFNVEMLMNFKIVYILATKIILIKWIISENRQLFRVDRICICKSKNISDYEEKAEQLKRSYKKKQLWILQFQFWNIWGGDHVPCQALSQLRHWITQSSENMIRFSDVVLLLYEKWISKYNFCHSLSV